MRYVWVSDRVPKGLKRFCAYCCTPIVVGYLRDMSTRLVYCGPSCYEEHVEVSEAYMEARHAHTQLVAAPASANALRLLPRPVRASNDMETR